MRYLQLKLSKSSSNLQYTRILEIIGLSDFPISSTEIHKRVINKYYPGNKKGNSNIYNIIKKLYKYPVNINQHNHVRFFKTVLNKKIKEEISRLEKKRSEIKDDYDHTLLILKINDLENNSRHRVYSLNLKGFLLYLIGSYNQYKELEYNIEKIKSKRKNIINTVYQVVKNLTDRDDLKHEIDFLKYFWILEEIYNKKTFVTILMEIAYSLEIENDTTQSQLILMTPEYLKYYFLRRLYDEIVIADISFKKLNFSLNQFSPFMDNQQKQELKEDEIDNDIIRESRKQILKKLIQLQEDQLKQMKEELNQI